MNCENCIHYEVCKDWCEAMCKMFDAENLWHNHPCTDRFQAKTEWISVHDRLPEDYNDVLVMATLGLMDVCFYDKSNKMWIYRSRYIEGSEVTHWMPLPPPPKGD